MASFIGSPSINFIEGTLEEANGKLIFNSEKITIDIPTAFRKKIEKNATSSKLTLGIRPEDFLSETIYIYDESESKALDT